MNLDEMMTDAVAALDELWQDGTETAAEYRRLAHRMHEEQQLEEAVDAQPAHEPSTSAAIAALGETLRETTAKWLDASARLVTAVEQTRRAGADAPEKADRTAAATDHQSAAADPSRLYLYPRMNTEWSRARAVCYSDIKLAPILDSPDEANQSSQPKRQRKAKIQKTYVLGGFPGASAITAPAWLGPHGAMCPYCDHSSGPLVTLRPASTYFADLIGHGVDFAEWIQVRVPHRSLH